MTLLCGVEISSDRVEITLSRSRLTELLAGPIDLKMQHQGPTNAPGDTKPHEDALRSWAKKLMQTKPFKLVAVALANKMARIAFAIMRG